MTERNPASAKAKADRGGGGGQTHFDQLPLIRSPDIGPVSYRQLRVRFGSARAVLDALPNLVRRGGGAQPLVAHELTIAQELQRAQVIGARHVFWEMQIIRSYCLNSLVGARNASADAFQFARQSAFELVQMELSVGSGLARGIDAAAHVGSTASGTFLIATPSQQGLPLERWLMKLRQSQDRLLTRGLQRKRGGKLRLSQARRLIRDHVVATSSSVRAQLWCRMHP